MFLHRNFLFIDLLEKKVLNKNLYNKYFIRHSFVEKYLPESSISIVDDNSNLVTANFNLKYFQRNYFKKLVFEKGYSVLLDNFLYTKKQIQFNYVVLNSQKSFLKYIPLFYKKLRALRSSKKVLILINAKRGGFRCFFNGTCGFFPFKHFFYLVKLNQKYKLAWFFNQIQNKDIQFIKFLRSSCMFLQNDTVFNRFYVRIKKSSKKGFKIPIFQFLYLILKGGRNIDIELFTSVVKRIFTVLKGKYLSNRFFNLNSLLVKEGRVLPRNVYGFVFYKLKFRIKNNYYNFFMQNRIKSKRRKKMFFKSKVKLVFLSFVKSKIKKEV